ncbi:DMT family transporter [Conexibacter arvalis]|uniref:Drug/metabolite transporter (DMT)-like permease n=1 Tax=Conexibacter arvalis TaxID=912552 RepID=A0A840I7B4_9ACTN|nr:DMT family transporter [Conexibacter arvalis]MBB4660786.1 drug/metabolite transporter (DMT)-like permease [Conexibacter arvalis]
MTALLLSLGASLTWGVADFGAGTAGRSRSPVAVALMLRFGGLVSIGLVALALAAPWDPPRMPLAVGAGVATALGGIALVRALAIGPMGITAPIIATSGIVPAVVGLFGGAGLGAVTLVGLAVACAGAVLASRARGHGGERANRAGIAAAVVTAVLIGSALLLIHEASKEVVVTAVLTQRLTEVTLLAALFATRRALRREAPLRPSAAILGLGVVESCAITLYATAAALGPLTLAAILSSLYPVVTVVLARTIHHERLTRLQRTGAALTLAGVALVVAGTA